jgi:hypothetical protein
MTDPRKVIVPTSVDSPTVGHLSAADLVKLSQVPREMMPDGTPRIVINVQQETPAPSGYRGDDLLRRFVPYFVITMMGLVIVGGITAILGLIIPVILGTIVAIIGSLVSIIMSIVATIIAAVVVALAITYCQTMNDRRGD